MIEINLARQIQGDVKVKSTAKQNFWWITILFLIGFGVVSWWWIQKQQEEYEHLLQEKQIQTQSFAKLQTTLSRLKQFQEEKRLLTDAIKSMQAQKLEKQQPMALLDGVSRSVDGLEIWLDRVEMVAQIVELRGQSYALHEIGKYIDALEHHKVITSLPIVEILDQKSNERGEGFSFMIRFDLEQQVTT